MAFSVQEARLPRKRVMILRNPEFSLNLGRGAFPEDTEEGAEFITSNAETDVAACLERVRSQSGEERKASDDWYCSARTSIPPEVEKARGQQKLPLPTEMEEMVRLKKGRD